MPRIKVTDELMKDLLIAQLNHLKEDITAITAIGGFISDDGNDYLEANLDLAETFRNIWAEGSDTEMAMLEAWLNNEPKPDLPNCLIWLRFDEKPDSEGRDNAIMYACDGVCPMVYELMKEAKATDGPGYPD